MAQNLTTFERLTLDLSRAAWNERWHQEGCRARADARDCRACLDHESDWLAADRALTAYLDAVAASSRPPVVLHDVRDERIALTEAGWAQAARKRRPSYADLFRACRVEGCDGDPEPRSQDCYRHQLVDCF